MNEALKKYSPDLRDSILAALTKSAIKEFVEETKAAADSGEFEVVVSTGDMDRQSEIVDQNGWMLDNYKKNPIVLWAHDYFSLPIGICTSIEVQNGKLVAKGQFAPESANPFAQQVRRLYDAKIVRATSVGFIPLDGGEGKITKAELLEFSFVPVPANPYALSLRQVKEMNLDMGMLVMKGLQFATTKGVVPKDVSDKKAPEDTPWEKPTLSDFTDKGWGDLTDEEKSHIAGFYAWAKEVPPETFGDLKLPHHRPSDGAVVWNGLKAAMGALLGARGGVDIPEGDRRKVYDHLAAHYKLFDKDAPDFKAKGAEVGDSCQMEDGSLGVLAEDPKNPDGALICVPAEKGKAADDEPDEGDEPNDEQALQHMRERLKTEHERHMGAVMDAIDEYVEKTADGEDEKAVQSAKAEKMGRAISKNTREKLKGIHEHLKAGIAAIEDLMAMPEDEPDGDEGNEEPDGDEPKGQKPETRSNPSGDDALETFLKTRDALKLIATVAGESLGDANNFVRKGNQQPKK